MSKKHTSTPTDSKFRNFVPEMLIITFAGLFTTISGWLHDKDVQKNIFEGLAVVFIGFVVVLIRKRIVAIWNKRLKGWIRTATFWEWIAGILILIAIALILWGPPYLQMFALGFIAIATILGIVRAIRRIRSRLKAKRDAANSEIWYSYLGEFVRQRDNEKSYAMKLEIIKNFQNPDSYYGKWQNDPKLLDVFKKAFEKILKGEFAEFTGERDKEALTSKDKILIHLQHRSRAGATQRQLWASTNEMDFPTFSEVLRHLMDNGMAECSPYDKNYRILQSGVDYLKATIDKNGVSLYDKVATSDGYE